MGRYGECTYFYTLYNAVEECFPAVDYDNARTILREAILAPNDYTVEFSDAVYTQAQIFNLIGQALKGSCVEESPEQTHYNLVEQATEVIKHMNDGYISHEDYKERCDYLDLTAKYEFSLFAALACLRVADILHDEKVYDELKLNIVRLREIRDIIQNYTRDEVDIVIERDEFERAKPIYRMLKSLQSLGYDYNFSPKERINLNIDHENDEDLTDRFNYYNWLKRLMLLQLRKEVSVTQNSTVSAFDNRQNKLSPREMSDKIAQLRGTMGKRTFDKDRFLMLNKAENSVIEQERNIS